MHLGVKGAYWKFAVDAADVDDVSFGLLEVGKRIVDQLHTANGSIDMWITKSAAHLLRIPSRMKSTLSISAPFRPTDSAVVPALFT